MSEVTTVTESDKPVVMKVQIRTTDLDAVLEMFNEFPTENDWVEREPTDVEINTNIKCKYYNKGWVIIQEIGIEPKKVLKMDFTEKPFVSELANKQFSVKHGDIELLATLLREYGWLGFLYYSTRE